MKVHFISINNEGSEVYGRLMNADTGTPLTVSGYWRTECPKDAAWTAIVMAGLTPSEVELTII